MVAYQSTVFGRPFDPVKLPTRADANVKTAVSVDTRLQSDADTRTKAE